MYLAEVPQHVTTLARFTALRWLTFDSSDAVILPDQVCLVILQLHVSFAAVRTDQAQAD